MEKLPKRKERKKKLLYRKAWVMILAKGSSHVIIVLLLLLIVKEPSRLPLFDNHTIVNYARDDCCLVCVGPRTRSNSLEKAQAHQGSRGCSPQDIRSWLKFTRLCLASCPIFACNSWKYKVIISPDSSGQVTFYL